MSLEFLDERGLEYLPAMVVRSGQLLFQVTTIARNSALLLDGILKKTNVLAAAIMISPKGEVFFCRSDDGVLSAMDDVKLALVPLTKAALQMHAVIGQRSSVGTLFYVGSSKLTMLDIEEQLEGYLRGEVDALAASRPTTPERRTSVLDFDLSMKLVRKNTLLARHTAALTDEVVAYVLYMTRLVQSATMI